MLMSDNDVHEVMINDPRISRVPIVDVGEGLVGVGVAALDHDRVRNDGRSRFSVRKGVARRLLVADARLGDASLVVVEGHRARAVQQRFWDHRCGQLRTLHPEWTEEQVAGEAARFVAPPEGHPPHSTGGAVDVIVVDGDGLEIDMGSALNDPVPEMAMAAEVSDQARWWRDRLDEAMTVAGFVNYPQEWWHFSYGDQYWAWRTNAPTARYGRID